MASEKLADYPRPAITTKHRIAAICSGTFVGAPFVGAALLAGGGPFVPTAPLPAGLMAVWPFEPEADSPSVPISSGRLCGAAFLIEGLRVDSGTTSGVEGRAAFAFADRYRLPELR